MLLFSLCVHLFVTPWTVVHLVSVSFTISCSLLKLISIESVMSSIQIILCHPLLLLPSIFPGIRLFSNELALCIRWPKYWSLDSASVLPVNIQGWFPLGLTVWSPCSSRDSQESFPAPLFKPSILLCSAFFMVQHSHLYMTTGKNRALTISTFVSKVISLLFNRLSRFVTAMQ